MMDTPPLDRITRTISGISVDVFAFGQEMVNAVDIAWSLYGKDRYNGHSYPKFDVLAHTALCYQLYTNEGKYPFDKATALAILLHDASEAYLCDVPRPLKGTPEFEFYKKLERDITQTILYRFGINPNTVNWEAVKRYDNQALWVEYQILRPNWHYIPEKEYEMDMLPNITSMMVLPQHLLELLRDFAIQFETYEINELFKIPEILEKFFNSIRPEEITESLAEDTSIPEYARSSVEDLR